MPPRAKPPPTDGQLLAARIGCRASAHLLEGHAADAKRPNILVVIADQWRAQAFGFAGDPNVKTPNFDALAHESVRCRNAVSGMSGLLARPAPLF